MRAYGYPAISYRNIIARAVTRRRHQRAAEEKSRQKRSEPGQGHGEHER